MCASGTVPDGIGVGIDGITRGGEPSAVSSGGPECVVYPCIRVSFGGVVLACDVCCNVPVSSSESGSSEYLGVVWSPDSSDE